MKIHDSHAVQCSYLYVQQHIAEFRERPMGIRENLRIYMGILTVTSFDCNETGNTVCCYPELFIQMKSRYM